MKMKNFRRCCQEILKEPTKKGYYVLDLDDKVGAGTHWVAMNVKDNLIEYFDSFGLDYPEEIIILSDRLSVNYVHNSTQFQDLMSVLWSHHCLHYINESKNKNSFCDIIKLFLHNDTMFNERFMIRYFMSSIYIWVGKLVVII